MQYTATQSINSEYKHTELTPKYILPFKYLCWFYVCSAYSFGFVCACVLYQLCTLISYYEDMLSLKQYCQIICIDMY